MVVGVGGGGARGGARAGGRLGAPGGARADGAGDRIGSRRARRLGAGGADPELVQAVRILPILRRHLHHDVVLVERVVDRRDLALPVGVVQRVVDRAGRKVQPRRGCAIDHEVGLQPPLLLVRIDLGEFRRPLQGRRQDRRPFVERGGSIALQRVLEFGVALSAAGAHVLRILQEQLRAGNAGELRPQPRDHLLTRRIAVGAAAQRDEEEAGVGGPPTSVANGRGDRGVVADDLDEGGELLLHQLERDALVGPQAAEQHAGVLLRKEALRHDAEQHHVEHDRCEQGEQHQAAVTQRDVERVLVEILHRRERALAGAKRPAMRRGGVAHPQEDRAQHRRRGERQHQRDHDRH